LRLLKRHHGKILFLLSPSLSLEEMTQVQKLASVFDAKLNGYDITEYDADFGDDYLKCNDLSSNRRGFNLLKIDETKEGLDEASKDLELIILIGRDDINSVRNYVDIEVKVSINASMPINQDMYDLYLPMKTHMSREGTFINIDGFLQFNSANIEYASQTQALSKIVSDILEENIFTCSDIWEDKLSKIIEDIDFERVKKEPIKMSTT